ncbi:MAG: hypothetical protein KDK38_07935, partial [Leptospiraceae bacterium]|nr:hypothetical protein [Leptospiraceae bacterium]
RWAGSNTEAGFKPEASSNYAVDIGENGAVTVHFAAAAGEALAGHELQLKAPSRLLPRCSRLNILFFGLRYFHPT